MQVVRSSTVGVSVKLNPLISLNLSLDLLRGLWLAAADTLLATLGCRTLLGLDLDDEVLTLPARADLAQVLDHIIRTRSPLFLTRVGGAQTKSTSARRFAGAYTRRGILDDEAAVRVWQT